MKRSKVTRSVQIEDKDFEEFSAKYKGHISERIQELIKLDLEEKVPEGENILTSYKISKKNEGKRIDAEIEV
jgi:hypothetical protein